MINSTNVVKSVVPAVAAMVFKAKETQSYMEPVTCAIASLAIFNMMNSFTRDDVVPAISLVELAKSAIYKANSNNNDIKEFHYNDSEIHLIGLAKRLGFISMNEDKSFTMSERWVELVTTVETARPFTDKVDSENRRKPFIKGGKVKPSKLLKEAIEFLQDTDYHVDGPMVDVVSRSIDIIQRSGSVLPAQIQQELHVWNGAKGVALEDKLYSDYFADTRARLYHVACAGPNPQSSDFARSLYSHNVENTVKKHNEDGSETESYRMFMSELLDVASGKWVETKCLTRVATNPSGALVHMLQSGDSPSKPFTYIRLALDWFKFETTGECDSRIGFGPDAKCSGTQYLAFISGSMKLAKATGLVNSPTKEADPYQLALVHLMELLEKSDINISQEILDEHLNKKTGRNFIKTPYMAIQYCGTKAALLESSEFTDYAKHKLQITEERLDNFAGICVDSIYKALGNKINMFISKTIEAVAKRCDELDKEFITYTHTDGFKVFKPDFPSRAICDNFSIRVNSQTRVIFGQQKDNKPWKIREAKPTRKEFARKFVVNYIQGIDALVARTVAVKAKKAGLRGYTSIHDCFRCCLADAPKLMSVIREAYIEIFVENNQFEHLSKQIGGIDMYHTNIVTKELVNSEFSYYFC